MQGYKHSLNCCNILQKTKKRIRKEERIKKITYKRRCLWFCCKRSVFFKRNAFFVINNKQTSDEAFCLSSKTHQQLFIQVDKIRIRLSLLAVNISLV